MYIFLGVIIAVVAFFLLILYSLGSRRGGKGLGAILVGLRAVGMAQTQLYGEVKYADLIREVVQFKPNDPKVKHCAIMKATLPDGSIELTIVYLDSNSEPVWGEGAQRYGFRKRTQKLDSELVDVFGDTDTIRID